MYTFMSLLLVYTKTHYMLLCQSLPMSTCECVCRTSLQLFQNFICSVSKGLLVCNKEMPGNHGMIMGSSTYYGMITEAIRGSHG